MEIREFRPEDMRELNLQPMQIDSNKLLGDMEYATNLKSGGDCYTAIANGHVVACLGLVSVWKYRRYVWAFLADDCGKHMIHLTRAVKLWLKYHGQGRIETSVDCNFPAAIRWAEMLGFEREGMMRQYSPLGADCYLYARVRPQ